MLKSVLGKGLVLAAVATLAACASTQPTETATTETTPTVYPQRETKPQGPVAGSMADLEQNVGHRVFFGYNQYNLTAEAQATLRRQAAWLAEYPEARIQIGGHCDERGTREYNLALGARRANAAKAYLVGLGVEPSRITTVSYGKERPIDGRSTPEAWSVNRNATTSLMSTVGS